MDPDGEETCPVAAVCTPEVDSCVGLDLALPQHPKYLCREQKKIFFASQTLWLTFFFSCHLFLTYPNSHSRDFRYCEFDFQKKATAQAYFEF